MVDLLFRDQWGASAPLGRPMRLPAAGVHVHHSVTNADADVAADMQELERIGVDRFGRFSYSYCGHPSGVVGEGAGLTVGAHTAGWNSITFGFCLIGNYEVQPVTDTQVTAFVEWRQWMVANGWLSADHWIEPHSARSQTACPGANTLARWGELVAAEPPRPASPPPPPSLEEDDMLIIESAGQDRGIWFLQGDTFIHLAAHETVSALLSAGVKSAKWADADFMALVEAKGALAAAAQAPQLRMQDVEAKMAAEDGAET